jgi:aldehyde:ferredoxin oxidoreductase
LRSRGELEADAMGGYAGKILRIDLADRKIGTIDTEEYRGWGGGHGMGSAIFYDIVVREKGVDLSRIDGFHRDNVVTMMTSPLCGTGVPAASGRTEVQGIGVQSVPIGWFTRSNFGGRFAAMLKFAGWDGIVIEGVSGSPAWVDIRDGEVRIKNCGDLGLWGTDTRECQRRIWDHVAGESGFGGFYDPGDGSVRTTQRPAVVAIGPVGEALSRLGCLVHDAGSASGEGGFGGVWGAKRLKAVSVVGTGEIEVDDPRALFQARLWQKANFGYDLGRIDPVTLHMVFPQFYTAPRPLEEFGTVTPTGGEGIPGSRSERKRPASCVGCHAGCRGRYESGIGNEVSCAASYFYISALTQDEQYRASDHANRYGANAYALRHLLPYLEHLHDEGVLGPGRPIECDLDFNTYGLSGFVEQLLKKISTREDDFGDTLAEDIVRAAEKWGRAEADLESGLLQYPYWGLPDHGYPPAISLEWGYGTILGDRDVNEHDFNTFFWDPMLAHALTEAGIPRVPNQGSAAEAVDIYTRKMVPYHERADRMRMLDYSTENMYSRHVARLVAWHRHYTRFFKQSLLYCDLRWPDFLNIYRADRNGSTPEAEPRFFNAVTGGDLTFAEGMELGRKIWNLDHAIWTLQGRVRDMVRFAGHVYRSPAGLDLSAFTGDTTPLAIVPGRRNGRWDYLHYEGGRVIDREKFEEFKTRFYEEEGWDPDTGFPTRATLSGLGLGYVADDLDAGGKLGLG